jgi:hypothetical protein
MAYLGDYAARIDLVILGGLIVVLVAAALLICHRVRRRNRD